MSGGASLQLHVLGLAMNHYLNDRGKLPETIFLQIDGGAENISSIVYAYQELLIASGLTKNVYVSRLIVGHTHCDIDAIFGVLWKAARRMHLQTQEDWKTVIEVALTIHKVFIIVMSCWKMYFVLIMAFILFQPQVYDIYSMWFPIWIRYLKERVPSWQDIRNYA